MNYAAYRFCYVFGQLTRSLFLPFDVDLHFVAEDVGVQEVGEIDALVFFDLFAQLAEILTWEDLIKHVVCVNIVVP